MARADPALWLSEADVVALLDIAAAVDAVERGLVLETEGGALNMLKTHVKWGRGDTLHALGAALAPRGVAGTKTWTHTAGGATPLLVLFDVESGALLAIIEAFALGQFRTGATAGVATRCLAAAGPAVLAVIGAGRQAMAQVAAVAAVRPLQAVRVFSSTPEHREVLAARVHEQLGVAAEASDSVREAVTGAAIVTLVTRAREPLLFADMLAPGAHVNALGAITPERAEIGADVFARCGVVAVDSLPAVQRLSREFQDHFGARGDWSGVLPLSRLVSGSGGRAAGVDLTLFKAMGSGLADVVVGLEVLERARRERRGRIIPHPEQVEIDWSRSARP